MNVDNPRGLDPHRHAGGGTLRTERFTIASGYAEAIGRGDPVELAGNGRDIRRAAPENEDNLGVFWGCEWTCPVTKSVMFSPYWPAGQVAGDAEAIVYTDPMTVFRMQCDNLAPESVGLTADWDAGAVDTATGHSKRELVASAAGASGGALRILGLVQEPGNAYGEHAVAEVMFAEHARL